MQTPSAMRHDRMHHCVRRDGAENAERAINQPLTKQNSSVRCFGCATQNGAPIRRAA